MPYLPENKTNQQTAEMFQPTAGFGGMNGEWYFSLLSEGRISGLGRKDFL